MDKRTVLELTAEILGVQPLAAERMTLTHSGNTIYDVTLPDRSVIVRMRGSDQETLLHTMHNTQALARLGLSVPSVLAADTSRTRLPFAYVILEKIQGRDLLYELDTMTPEQMTRLAERIVTIQRRVGTLPQGTGYGWGQVGGGGGEPIWFDVLDAQHLPPNFNCKPLAELHLRLYQKRLHLQPYFRRVAPVCFLEDLTTKNVLLQNGEFQGIIDFDSVCFGDPLWQIGLAAGCILNDVGEQGQFYIEELCRCWNLTEKQREVVAYYSAQRALEFLEFAFVAQDETLMQRLTRGIDCWLNVIVL